MSLEGLIAVWGPPAVFAGCFAEGETAAVLGGMIAHRGLAGWLEIAGLAAAGACLADQMWFLLARHAGRGGRLAALKARAGQSRIAVWAGRHAVAATLAFRFVPGTRIAGPLVLAQTALPWRVFALLNALSVAVWAVVFTGIGYHFGRAAEALWGRLPLHHWGLVLGGTGAVLLALHLALRTRR